MWANFFASLKWIAPFSILSLKETGKIPKEPIKDTTLQEIIKLPYNTPMLLDTYPFTDGSWCLKNMDNSRQNTNDLVYRYWIGETSSRIKPCI